MKIPEAVRDRFNLRVDRTGECWLWLGAKDRDGYGQFTWDYINYRSHRFALMIDGRPVPEGMVTRHLCNTRSCVRPSHLRAGTISENILDEVRSGSHHKLRYSQEIIDSIREDYANGGVTTRALAAKYGVSKSQVHCIVSGQTRFVRAATVESPRRPHASTQPFQGDPLEP